jgi:hypothetical protein
MYIVQIFLFFGILKNTFLTYKKGLEYYSSELPPSVNMFRLINSSNNWENFHETC